MRAAGGGGGAGGPKAAALAARVRDLRARVAAADQHQHQSNGGISSAPQAPTAPPQTAYDAVAWRAAADELRAQPVLSDALRAVYEDVLALFPTAAQLWARWAELELGGVPSGGAGPDAAKRLFARCLVSCPTADLYALYIRCIRRANEPRGVEAVPETRAAFEHALSAAGQDAGAGPIWLEYLSWLQAPKAGTPEYLALFSTGLVGGDEEGERARSVRDVFHRAIAVPTHALEAIWRQYEAFENGQAAAIGGGAGAKAAAAKVIAEQRARFQAARVCYRDRKRRIDSLDLGCLAFPPGRVAPAQRAPLERQAGAWAALVEFERSNPQRLEPAALAARVSLAYDQALMVGLHRPEWWLQAARWHAEESAAGGAGAAGHDGAGAGAEAAAGNPAAAVALLRRGVAALPACLLLHFALADAEEARGRADAAKAVYEGLVSQLEPPPAPPPSSAAAADAGPPPPAPPPLSNNNTPVGGPLLQLPEDQAALAWSAYLRFLRRTEPDLTACRRLFVRARRSARCPWRVYAEAALLEWRHGGANGPDVARRIFEKGLESAEIAAAPEYVLRYAAFLSDSGDAGNCRALFERALATEAACRASRRVWAAYAALERERGGDLAAVTRVERRAREALGRAAAEAGDERGGGGTAAAAAAAADRARAEGDRCALALQLRRYACEGVAPLASAAERLEVEHAAGPGWAFGGWGCGGFGSEEGGVGGGGGGKGGQDGGAAAAAAGGAGGAAGYPPLLPQQQQQHAPPPLPRPMGGLGGAGPPHSPASGGGGIGGGGGGGGASSGGGGGGGGGVAVGGYPPSVGRFLAALPPPHLLDGPMPDPMAVAHALLQADFSPHAIAAAVAAAEGMGGGSDGGGGMRKRATDDGGGDFGRGPPRRRLVE